MHFSKVLSGLCIFEASLAPSGEPSVFAPGKFSFLMVDLDMIPGQSSLFGKFFFFLISMGMIL